MDASLQKMTESAQAGGRELKKYFGGELTITQKSMPSDFATQADVASEEVVSKILEQAYPDYNFRGEESGTKDKGSEYTFVVDPLDGTSNFSMGFPYFSVLIALLKNNEVIAGVVHDPILNSTYHAKKGGGVFLNDEPIKVSVEDDITRSTILCMFGYSNYSKETGAYIDAVNKRKAKRAMNNWSPGIDFCLLASGKVEGAVVNGIELHDFLVGKLMLQEAGAKITDFEGNPDNDIENAYFIASNGTNIHEELLDVVRDAKQILSD